MPLQVTKRGPRANRLLAALPEKDLTHLLASCESVDLTFADVLCEQGARIRHVYFPIDGFISLVAPVDGYAGCIAAISKIDTTDRLKEIRAPALVICGEQDAGTPPAMSHAINKAMPGSTLVLIPNAAHLSNVDQPEAFTGALTTFIAKHS